MVLYKWCRLKEHTCFILVHFAVLFSDYSDAPGSDSGLSGLDNPGIDSMTKRAPLENENSIVDSGRRSQSLEILSDDLRSMTLSTPSSPSPRPPSSQANNKGHVHFMSAGNSTMAFAKEAENQTLNPAEIVRSMVAESELG